MEWLRKFFKGDSNNVKANLVVVIVIGVILLILTSNAFRKNKKDLTMNNNTVSSVSELKENGSTYEAILESRLKKALSKVEGVGNVDVMLTLSYGKELVLAKDVATEESKTIENDSNGGMREINSKSLNSKNVIISGSGSNNQPLIIKELEPKVEGVIIIASGGDNVYIKESLINATKAILGIDAHKIQVLKMKTIN